MLMFQYIYLYNLFRNRFRLPTNSLIVNTVSSCLRRPIECVNVAFPAAFNAFLNPVFVYNSSNAREINC